MIDLWNKPGAYIPIASWCSLRHGKNWGVENTSNFLKLREGGVEKNKYSFTHKELRMQLRINIQFHCSDYTVEDLENGDKI